ncbi:MAG TPA: hypothetical protein VEQ60_29370 [Longimicrobium sp.]|nr:hypothetical protein [Longimicrobium sp.]
MSEYADEVLVDAPLVADPDAGQELSPDDPQTLGDEDLKGSRLLVVRRGAWGRELASGAYGVVQIACTFQPAEGARFTWARIALRLEAPPGVRILDLAPRVAPEGEPVKITLSQQGRLGIRALSGEARGEHGARKEFLVYHCQVQGAGESTPLARWDFRENPHRRDGIGPEQELLLTLPVVGPVSGTLTASARLVRPGVAGGLERFRDLVLRRGPHERRHPVSFDITTAPRASDDARFLHMD